MTFLGESMEQHETPAIARTWKGRKLRPKVFEVASFADALSKLVGTTGRALSRLLRRRWGGAGLAFRA